MRADSLAEKLLEKDVTGFWKEVRALNKGSTLLPCSLEGVSGADNIVELWRQHYSALFNCVNSEPFKVHNCNESISFTAKEVYQAIAQLADNKASGSDQISAEHLKLASPKLAILLSICFTSLMYHGLLPESLLSVTLVPVIKDKAVKVGSLDNYRPIALASILSKILEKVILERLSSYLSTTDNQFGFKAKLGTCLCIYSLK